MNAVEKMMIVANYALTHLARINAFVKMDITCIMMEKRA